ncbi:MAG: hypothetical protein IPJ77_23250 [Planctomycetes bacterium]|nr:hypothetical protein [Planctomycetota bacterium]
MPPPELRQRVTRGIERVRAHERRAWLAACAATLLVTCAVRITMPALETADATVPRTIAPRELVAIGFDAADAERLARMWSSSRVPRVAPIQATASVASFVQGGL